MRALLLALLAAAPAAAGLSRADDAFLEDLSRRSFAFFWDYADPATGLVLDRARADGSGPDAAHARVASAATTGFGLSALCIAAERGWVPARAARARAAGTLRFLAEQAPREHGWFYHWMDSRTGARVWNSELSSTRESSRPVRPPFHGGPDTPPADGHRRGGLSWIGRGPDC